MASMPPASVLIPTLKGAVQAAKVRYGNESQCSRKNFLVEHLQQITSCPVLTSFSAANWPPQNLLTEAGELQMGDPPSMVK